MVPIPVHPRMLPSAPSFSRPVVARPSLKTFDAATMYPPSGVDRMSWNPEKFDWYDYWMNIHMPGLKKWVLPTLEEDMRAQPRRVYTYRDLLEMFETTTKRHETRVAMRIERDGHKEQYTYADLRELAFDGRIDCGGQRRWTTGRICLYRTQ